MNKKRRRTLWVVFPDDVDDVQQPEVEEPAPAEDGSAQAHRVIDGCAVYAIPGGPGQTKALNDLLVKHEIDPRNAGRVLVFRGRRKMEVKAQYNVRWK